MGCLSYLGLLLALTAALGAWFFQQTTTVPTSKRDLKPLSYQVFDSVLGQEDLQGLFNYLRTQVLPAFNFLDSTPISQRPREEAIGEVL